MAILRGLWFLVYDDLTEVEGKIINLHQIQTGKIFTVRCLDENEK